MRDIIIINDYLHGLMGERVIWNFMLEGVPNIKGIDMEFLNCSRGELETKAKEYIDNNFDKDAIIIQNATFLNKIDNDRFTIAFLQDNLRKMNRYDPVQEHVLSSSQHIVFNSKEISLSYPEYNGTVIPIGVDHDLFCPMDKNLLRKKYNIPDNKIIAIFVGALNDVKGWSEVINLIEKNSLFFLIVVSKHDESYQSSSARSFSKLHQQELAELLNCADFFILGSPTESLCLAAVEAGFCNLPVIMKETGIFMDWSDDIKNNLGCFNNNLELALIEFLLKKKQYSTRNQLMNLDLSIPTMIQKWINLLEGC